METEGLLTIEQAATALKIKRRAVEIAIQRGYLAHVEVLGRRAILKSSLEDYRRLHPKGRPKKRSGEDNNISQNTKLLP